jgi:gamma-glutamylcyclotransferase (GGCT)/AIG2-like uncharacterized protein YtfP
LRRLDRLEGNGRTYHRRVTRIHFGDSTVRAWIYLYRRNDGRKRNIAPVTGVVEWRRL